jgi:ADP-heptose:LPS heptosyltransferase
MKKVLVIRFSSLGDIVLSSVVLNPLYKNDFQIDFLLLGNFAPLFEKDFRINKLIKINKQILKTPSSIKDLANKLKKENYDYVIDLHSNWRSSLIAKNLKVETLKYKKNSVKRRLYLNPFFRIFIRDKFNVVLSYLKTLERFNIENLYSYRPYLIVEEEEKNKIKEKINLPENFIVIGAGARYKKKFYPHYNKVSELLIKESFNIVLIGSESDKKLDKNIYPSKVLDLRGKL